MMMTVKPVFSKYQFKGLVLLLFPYLSFCQQNFTATNLTTDAMATAFIKKYDVPGLAISISYNDTIVYSKGFGFANIEKQLPVIPSQSQFRIGSITKTLTAMALGRLKEQGKLDFDASIYKYIDSLPKKEYDFTIRQVGGHMAGLKRMYMEYNTDSLKTVSRSELYRSFTGKLLYKPGTQHQYSNFGFELLGIVVGNVQYSSFEKAMRQLVLQPLNMANTDAQPNSNNNTKYYTTNKEGVKTSAHYMNHNANTASGYYYSTSEDLVKMGNALMYPNRLLSKETLLELIKPQKLASGKSTGYGFGVEAIANNQGKWSYGHSGHIYGGTSFYGVSPSYKFVIVVLINCDYLKAGKINELAQSISTQYFKVIDEK